MDKKDFYISPLKHEDVILGAPWFDRIGATMKFPEKKVLFQFRGKDVILDVKGAKNTILYINDSTLAQGIKSSISCYLIFVKNSHKDSSDLQSETEEDLELSKFL